MELRDPYLREKILESRKKPNIFIRFFRWIKSIFIKKEDTIEVKSVWVEPEVIESLPYDPNKPNYINE